jgi:ribosomal protein S18 acetylase RimI-like enzyme
MTWRLTRDLDAFEAATGDFVRARSTHNTILLSVPAQLHSGGMDRFGDEPPRFGWYEDADGAVQGVIMQTPPHPVLLSEMTDAAAAALVGAFAEAGWPLDGVNGPVRSAEAVGAAWQDATGREYGVHRRLRLYVLPELVRPSPLPPGRARVAEEADRELLVRWYREFCDEIDERWGNPERTVDDRLKKRGIQVWEVDGTPVSAAGITEPMAGGLRVTMVYTPKEYRGRGYAGAVTSVVSQVGLDKGAQVSLFTDLANPTSNALYQRLGYRAVEDRAVLSFED